jgi:predicted amidohydrolase YtcJ
MRVPRRRFLCTLAAATAACTRRGPSAAPTATGELLVRGGTIWTGDPDTPRVEAVACRGGTIVAVGRADAVARAVGARARVVELQGGMATAGLVDAHAHLVGLGQSLEVVDLRGSRSVAEVIDRLRTHGPNQGWLLGRGWDQNLWTPATMPDHAALDAAFGDRPVWLRRVDGHAGWASAALLRAAGIDRDRAAPPGGEILRDAAGDPTGVLVDAAMELVSPPAGTADDVRRWILAGAAHATARGLTGVHEMGIGREADAIYRALVSEGALPLRVHAYADEAWLAADHTEARGGPDAPTPGARYLLRGVKIYADGALGSRGAAMLADYDDRPGHRGLLQHDAEQLGMLARRCFAGGWQPATHAIGDAANRAVLAAYRVALAEARRVDVRPRIEHCQIVAPEDIAVFAELGVIASMQPTHATSDMPWVPDRVGAARLPGAYAWRRFLDAGVPLAFGSDFPVERVDPIFGIHAAVTRQDEHGAPAGGWLPDQRLDLDQALAAFTRAAAFAVHRERELGMLRVGMAADLTAFDRVLDARDPAALRAAEVIATVVGGAVVHSA